jgi:hypothetical protein
VSHPCIDVCQWGFIGASRGPASLRRSPSFCLAAAGRQYHETCDLSPFCGKYAGFAARNTFLCQSEPTLASLSGTMWLISGTLMGNGRRVHGSPSDLCVEVVRMTPHIHQLSLSLRYFPTHGFLEARLTLRRSINVADGTKLGVSVIIVSKSLST